MSGKYVPPSRREGYVAKPDARPPWIKDRKDDKPMSEYNKFDQLDEIFGAIFQGTYNYFRYRAPEPTPTKPLPYDPTRTPENIPLPPAVRSPVAPRHPLGDLVCYVMTFGKGHPLWHSGGELWSHTDSHILASDWKGDKRNFGRPIPVFHVENNSGPGKLGFLGWWTMNALREVEPHSDELVDLLDTKERMRSYPRGRTKEQWGAALSDRWIKTRLTPVEETHPRYQELVDPLALGPKEGGRLVLSLGGLEEELKVFETCKQPEKGSGEEQEQEDPQRQKEDI